MKTLSPCMSLALALFLWFNAPLSAEEYRALKSSDGKIIEATVTGFDATRGVSLKTKGGQIFKDVPVDRFSIDDQNYFKTWAVNGSSGTADAPLTAENKIKITVRAGQDKSLNKKGDPDNLEVSHEPGISFDLTAEENSYQKVNGTLVFIGQSVIERDEYHILYREDFTVDLPSGEIVKWDGTPFTNIYDSIPGNGSAFGAAYDGYLLVLRNKQGVISVSKSSSAKFLEYAEAILKADLRQGHSKDFATSAPKSHY